MKNYGSSEELKLQRGFHRPTERRSESAWRRMVRAALERQPRRLGATGKPSCNVFVRERAVRKTDGKAGLLASGSFYWLHLPAAPAPVRGRLPAVVFAAFVPGYSGGTATDLHRFPYSSSAATSRERHLASKGPNLSRRRRLSTSQLAVRGAKSLCGFDIRRKWSERLLALVGIWPRTKPSSLRSLEP